MPTQAQLLTTIQNALKDNYLPAWKNQLGTAPSALLAKIKKTSLEGNKIVSTAPIGLSGGFGYGAEGQATPGAGATNYQRFETTAKDMYVNVEISAKTIKLGKTNTGSMINALDNEVKSAYETAKWNLGRSLFGNGTGILTNFSALSTAGNELTVADTKFLKEGLLIDIYKDKGTSPVATQRRIKSVNRGTKKIIIDGDASTFEAGFITVQNSFNREITGLGTIFDDNIKTIYGVSKDDNPYVKPVVFDASNDIDDGIITKALRQASRDKNSNIDLIMAGDDAYDAYVTYLRTNNVRVEDMSKNIEGGFKAIKFLFGDKEVSIVNESFVPTSEMWGVDTTALELHSLDWDFEEQQGGSIFTLMEGKSIYRALMSNYGNLICSNPGGCVRIYNVA